MSELIKGLEQMRADDAEHTFLTRNQRKLITSARDALIMLSRENLELRVALESKTRTITELSWQR